MQKLERLETSIFKGLVLTVLLLVSLTPISDAGHAPYTEGWASGFQTPYVETDYIRFHVCQILPNYEGGLTFCNDKLIYKDTTLTNRTVEIQSNKGLAGGYPNLNTSGRIPVAQIGDIVRDIRLNSSTVLTNSINYASSAYIKPILSGTNIVWNFIGNIVNSITVGANTLVGAIILSGGPGISVTNTGNTITFTDVNNTSIKAGSGISVSKAGNTVTISSTGGASVAANITYTMWRSDAAGAVALQGLNLAAARTELDATMKGTRHNTTFINIPSGREYSCYARFTKISTTVLTVRIRIAERFDMQQDLLCLIVKPVSTPANGRYFAYNSTWQTLPAWWNANNVTQTIAVITQGGDALEDFIFHEIGLMWRNG